MLNDARHIIGVCFWGVAAASGLAMTYVKPTDVDRCVASQLAQSKLTLPDVCDDAVFLRRVHLDLTGLLPETEVVRAFLKDNSVDKRQALIDKLLVSNSCADYQALKWLDLLRVKSEFPANLWPNAVQVYSRWIQDGLAANKPYDVFVREMLTASGSNFRDPPVNFFRSLPQKDATNIAAFVAQSLMGIRFTSLPPSTRGDLARFFSAVDYKATTEWKEEIVFFNHAKQGTLTTNLRFPDGKTARCAPDSDPRLLFASWLTSDGNPFFARCIVNRIWFQLMGRGIIHEADDLRPDNPPANPALLALLEKVLSENAFDLHAVYRLILNSRTYQAEPFTPPETLARRTGYAFYQIRQLDADVLLDIICQISGSTENYSSQVPEPYTNFSESRSVRIGDGSVTSPFLEMFGRPPRDTGLLGERANWPTIDQRLHLLNASHIQRKLQRPPVFGKFGNKKFKRPPVVPPVEELFLLTLSRYPTPEERLILQAYNRENGGPDLSIVQDVLWALVNTKEFCVRR